MPIYDNNGTTNAEIGKLYDNDGTASYQIGKVYDNNSTTNSLIYSAEFAIYDNGSQPNSTQTGGVATKTGGDAKVSIGSSAITGSYTDIYVNGTQCRITTKNPIDVTGFTKLCIDVQITSTYNNYECLLRCVSWNPVTTSDLPANGWGAFDGEIVGVKRQTVSIDVSALTGNYYPLFLSYYTNFSIYKFWLE